MKRLLILPVMAMALALLAPAAQADPDLPDGSGDSCATAVDLGDAAVGTVGGGDSEDWYRNSGSADEIQIDNLTPRSSIRFDVYDNNCDHVDSGSCSIRLNALSGECDVTGRAEVTVYRLADGEVRVPGIRISVPADGHIELTQGDSETGAASAYALNRVAPDQDQQL